jgi:Arc/MetJ-type ribon-helix-helix transcriptional regulator
MRTTNMSAKPGNRTRRFWPLALNLLAPGAGLVILRREWLGLSLAMLFVVAAQVALWGLFIVPATVPRPVALLGAVGAGVVWLISGKLTLTRARLVLHDDVARDVDLLREGAERAVDEGRFADAGELLRQAMALDDQDPAVRSQWARVMALTGRFGEARRAWRSVLRLDPDHERRSEAVMALERLPHE